MKQRRAVEGDIPCSIPDYIKMAVEKSKRIAKNWKERLESGPLDDQKKKRRDIVERLEMLEPSSWNNIPIPVQDALTDIITSTVFSTNV